MAVACEAAELDRERKKETRERDCHVMQFSDLRRFHGEATAFNVALSLNSFFSSLFAFF